MANEELFSLSDGPVPLPIAGSNVHVFVGGIGSLLELMGYPVNNSVIWSSEANIDRPELVKQAIQMYIVSGADIIEPNTYHMNLRKLRETRDLGPEEAEQLIHDSVTLARETVAEIGKTTTNSHAVAILGSIGPYATYLRDGSEYTGTYAREKGIEQTIVDHYLEQANAMIAAGVHTLLLETIPSVKEAECLRTVLTQLGPDVRAWVTATCQDGKRTRSGDLFADFVRVVNRLPKVTAVGINCTDPEHITPLLEEANRAGNKLPLIVYPGTGEQFNAAIGTFEGVPQIDFIVNTIPCWYELGVRIFGGCCRIYPDAMARIVRACQAL